MCETIYLMEHFKVMKNHLPEKLIIHLNTYNPKEIKCN